MAPPTLLALNVAFLFSQIARRQQQATVTFICSLSACHRCACSRFEIRGGLAPTAPRPVQKTIACHLRGTVPHRGRGRGGPGPVPTHDLQHRHRRLRQAVHGRANLPAAGSGAGIRRRRRTDGPRRRAHRPHHPVAVAAAALAAFGIAVAAAVDRPGSQGNLHAFHAPASGKIHVLLPELLALEGLAFRPPADRSSFLDHPPYQEEAWVRHAFEEAAADLVGTSRWPYPGSP
ncbi:hypothetical protein DFJ73DRAFT_821605 [Zopfochytrium polystomum]|nr:hypothetical protein DFJ73DRAFT_821605 [Zopfochytrium polystomum]